MNVIWHHFHSFDEHTVLCCRGVQHVLKPYLHISDENLLTIFRAPHDVVLEAKDCPCILAVSAVCSDFYAMSLLGPPNKPTRSGFCKSTAVTGPLRTVVTTSSTGTMMKTAVASAPVTARKI